MKEFGDQEAYKENRLLGKSIGFKKVGLHNIKVIETINKPSFVVIYDHDIASIYKRVTLENIEFYIIKLEDEIIGLTGIMLKEDSYEIEDLIIDDKYHDIDCRSTILKAIQSIFTVA